MMPGVPSLSLALAVEPSEALPLVWVEPVPPAVAGVIV
jgi:hypothetical protein